MIPEETLFEPVISSLRELQEEGVSKSIHNALNNVISILSTNDEPPIAIRKALAALEHITENNTLSSDTKMELIRAASILESF